MSLTRISLCIAALFGGAATSLAQIGVQQPTTARSAAFYPIPTQSYALIDVSGAEADQDVWFFSIDDDNHGAFAYFAEDGNTLTVKSWDNGIVTPNQVITPLFKEEDGGDPPETRWQRYLPWVVTPLGKVYGRSGLITITEVAIS